MNKLFNRLLVFLLLTFSVYGFSQDAVYPIRTVEELVQFRDAINEGSTYKGVDLSNGGVGMQFTLTDNMDLSSVCGEGKGNWVPIGTEKHPFRGHFSGSNYTVDNLYIDVSDPAPGYEFLPAYGFFGVIDGSTTEGMATVSYLIIGSKSRIFVEGEAPVGGIAGIAQGFVQIDNSINNASVLSRGDIGGIVGLVKDVDNVVNVYLCENNGTVFVSGYNYGGGIVGRGTGTGVHVSRCVNSATVNGVASAAGIIGKADANGQSILRDNLNKGDIVAGKAAAGISVFVRNIDLIGNVNLGEVQASTIAAGIVDSVGANVPFSQCMNAGKIFASSLAGGITAFDMSNTASYNVCVNVGSVDSKMYAGGIVANIKGDSSNITRSQNAGHVGGGYVGGFVGAVNGILNLDHCLNVGTMDTTGMDDQSFMGSMVGMSTNKIVGTSYYDKTMNPLNAVGHTERDADNLIGLVTDSLIKSTLPAGLKGNGWNATYVGLYPELNEVVSTFINGKGVKSDLLKYPLCVKDDAWSVASGTFDQDATVESTKGKFSIDNGKIISKGEGYDALTMTVKGISRKIDLFVASAPIGSKENPLTISSLEEFVQFRDAVNDSLEYKGVKLVNGAMGLWFKLTEDINLYSVCNSFKGGWQPIQNFSGNFDGDGHTISGLYLKSSDVAGMSLGLFSRLSADKDTMIIQNLKISGPYMDVGGQKIAGALAGQAISGNVVIKGIEVTNLGVQLVGVAEQSSSVGGVIGNTVATLLVLDSNVVHGVMGLYGVSASIGGIVGTTPSPAVLTNNISRVGFEVKNSRVDVGGIAGQVLSNRNITGNTYENGGITCENVASNSFIGGIIGVNPWNSEYPISHNTNSNSIKVSGTEVYVGGIAGFLMGTKPGLIVDNVNTGDITVSGVGKNSKAQVGGIAGIYNVYFGDSLVNKGNITVTDVSSSIIGGIAANPRDVPDSVVLTNCVSIGAISIANNDSTEDDWSVTAAGFVGSAYNLSKVVVAGNSELQDTLEVKGEAPLRLARVVTKANVDSGKVVAAETVSDKLVLVVKEVSPKEKDGIENDRWKTVDKSFKLNKSPAGLNLELPGAGLADVKVFDLVGNQVKVQTMQKDNLLEISGIPQNGTFLLVIKTSQGKRSFKVGTPR